MSKEKNESPKPHVNIGMVGRGCHNKEFLIAAVHKVLSTKSAEEATKRFSEENDIIIQLEKQK